MSTLIRVSLIFLAVTQLVITTNASRGPRGLGSKYNYYNRGQLQAAAPKTFMGSSSGIPSQNASRRGLGISAWGIIAIIITVILSGMGCYYFAMCYPIICKKQRKYDMMGLPSAA